MPRELYTPNHIYRECDAKSIFGFSPSTLRQKIKIGEIPAPHLLSSPPSRARGWWGWQLNSWAEKVEQQQAAWASEQAEKYYKPKGGNLRKATPAPEAPTARPKVKKVKGLKRPAR